MLDIRLELSEVNHRKCLEVLLPPLVEHCASKTEPGELDRFLAGLGKEAVPAACSLLEEMDADGRDSVVVWLVSAHEERLRSSANRHLAGLLGDGVVSVGRFAALDRPGSRLALLAAGVEADYPRLLKSSLVKEGIEQLGKEHAVLKGAAMLAVQMGLHMSADSLEKQALIMLNSARLKQRIVEARQDGVRQAGLEVTVEDAAVERSAAAMPPQSAGVPAVGGSWMSALRARAEEMRRNK